MTILSRLATLTGAAFVAPLRAIREFRLGTEFDELREVVAEQALLLVTAAEAVATAEDRAEKAEADFATHECEELAGGALDAQAEAERALFAMRDELADAIQRAHRLKGDVEDLTAELKRERSALAEGITIQRRTRERDKALTALADANAEARGAEIDRDEARAELAYQCERANSAEVQRDEESEQAEALAAHLHRTAKERDQALAEVAARGDAITSVCATLKELRVKNGELEEQVRWHEVGPGYAKREELRAELGESDATQERLAELLTGVANAIKGDPAKIGEHGGIHSWHDLPELVAKQVWDLKQLGDSGT